MRLFLAIEIPDEIKAKLNKQIAPLRHAHGELSWVAPENFHLTIHFYGEVPDAKPIIKSISDVLYDMPAFHLFGLAADMFITHKILLYVEFRRQKVLEQLSDKIKSVALSPFHYSQKYDNVPHVTIARYKIPSKQQYFHLQKELERLDIDIDFPVDHVTLYQSILKTQAPEYKKIAEFPLLTEE